MKLHPSFKTIIPLALSAFCMGVAELSLAGILRNLSESFEISLQKAGYLTTLYALGVIIGAPLLSIPISKFHRKAQLLCNLGIFALANFVLVLTSDFYLTAFARFVAGCMHGVFFVIATLSATQVAQKGKESQALAIVVSGLTLSMVSGVPLGAWIGNSYGYQALFLCITLLIASVMICVWICMPNNLEGRQTHLKGLLYGLKTPKVWKSYWITACFCGSIFALYTYIEPFLIQLGHFSPNAFRNLLLVYGIFGIIGNLFGGKLADLKGCVNALKITLGMLSLSLFAMGFSVAYPYGVAINFVCVSFWGFACVASVKLFALQKATKYTPQHIDSTISLNEASFNLGIASATFLGGIALTYLGVRSVAFVAGGIAFLGFITIFRHKASQT